MAIIPSFIAAAASAQGPRRSYDYAAVEQQICRQYAYGDGAITPAISVLSALEGLDIIFPAFAPYVLPVSVPGTVEERIVELQEKKGRLAAATLDARGAVGSLAAEDLDYLFGE